MHLFGIKRVGALYLVRSTQSCILDSGTKKEAKRLIQVLDSMEAFPPDMIIITHSHYDHSQGVPVFCREAKKRGKKIQVMASEKAVPNLRDQSWNRVFHEKESYENLLDVKPLKDGEVIDLGGLELEYSIFQDTAQTISHCSTDSIKPYF